VMIDSVDGSVILHDTPALEYFDGE
jgi:hypothetical protein